MSRKKLAGTNFFASFQSKLFTALDNETFSLMHFRKGRTPSYLVSLSCKILRLQPKSVTCIPRMDVDVLEKPNKFFPAGSGDGSRPSSVISVISWFSFDPKTKLLVCISETSQSTDCGSRKTPDSFRNSKRSMKTWGQISTGPKWNKALKVTFQHVISAWRTSPTIKVQKLWFNPFMFLTIPGRWFEWISSCVMKKCLDSTSSWWWCATWPRWLTSLLPWPPPMLLRQQSFLSRISSAYMDLPRWSSVTEDPSSSQSPGSTG